MMQYILRKVEGMGDVAPQTLGRVKTINVWICEDLIKIAI